MKRSGFTLIELLVVLAIIGILAALSFGALHWARDEGRKARTRTTITKINSIIMEGYESCGVRRLPVPAGIIRDARFWVDTDGDGTLDTCDRWRLEAAKWNMRRDFLRMEMPDRFADFLGAPLDVWPLNSNPAASKRERFLSSYNRAKDSLASLDADGDGTPDLTAEQVQDRLDSYELSECLYLTAMVYGGNKIKWRDDERGDADGDGLREFHDAWGHPIMWLRWPAGWPGADELPINYDPSVRPALQTMGPYPIIMSAGPDGIYDVNRGVEPDGAGGWKTYEYGLDMLWGNLNPWTLDDNAPPCRIGEPIDATAPNGDPPNGRLDHLDNLTSYDLGR